MNHQDGAEKSCMFILKIQMSSYNSLSHQCGTTSSAENLSNTKQNMFHHILPTPRNVLISPKANCQNK